MSDGKTVKSGNTGSSRGLSSSGKKQEPEMIKDYKIVSVIGEGGMGKVYKAIHPTLKTEIILKELKIRDKETRERFLREAKVMLEFRHENIVHFFDHFKEGNSTYIAMEYVKGMALNLLIKQCEQIPIPLALYILYQAALGLHHAHSKNVIHRDIKPHNLLISENGEVKIIDFGIAAQRNNDDEKESLTAPGTVIGTPAYMSPEQFNTNGNITIQSDIYSLGVVFYEMITGVRPFRNEYSGDVIQAIAKGNYPPVTKYIKKVPPIVYKVLNKTFNPDPKKRYKTLRPLINLLARYFKNYSTLELKTSIRYLLKDVKDLSKYPYYTKHMEITKRNERLALTALVASVIILVTTLLVVTNRHYEWFLRWHYGKVILTFNKANLDPDSTLIKIDNDYVNAKMKNNVENYKRVLYLPKGYHEIAIVSGSYKTLRKFELLSISMLEKNQETKDGYKIDLKISNLLPKEVMLYLRFWDSINPTQYLFQFDYFTDVTDKLRASPDYLYILDTSRNSYVKLKDYYERKIKAKQHPFLSDNTYTFMVKGLDINGVKYDNRIFKLRFGLDERTVASHIHLAQNPAIIKINSFSSSNNLFVNGKNSGYVFDKDDYKIVSYNSIKGKKNKNKRYNYTIMIPPGNYDINIGNGKKMKVSLKSNDILELVVNKEKGKIVY